MPTTASPVTMPLALDERALLAQHITRLDFTCVGESGAKRVFRSNHLSKAGLPIYLLENGEYGELYVGKLGVTSTARLILQDHLDVILIHLLALRMARIIPAPK